MMFDVSWSDPTSETVAQRRSRKEKEQKTVSSGSSQKTVRSDDSSSGLRRPFPLTLLNSNRKDVARPTSRPQSSAQRPKSAVDQQPSTHSSHVSRAQTSAHEHSGVPLRTNSPSRSLFNADYTNAPDSADSSPCVGEMYFHNFRQTVITDGNAESSFASWASQSVTTDSTWTYSEDHNSVHSHLIQPLSPTSFVSRSTEITMTSHEDNKDDPKNATFVEIYSDGSPSHPSPLQFSSR